MVNVVSPSSPLLTKISNKENSTSVFSLYPNPAKEKIIISAKGKMQNVTYEIFDFTGKQIEVQNSNCKIQSSNTFNFELSTLHLSSGIYFLKATDGNGRVEVMKFVKE
jgi:hypothetical protein